jgi:hypothetical protein
MAKEFKLEITFDAETKDCKVTGPVNEKDLCFMGLELARRVIEQYHRKRIIVPMAAPIPQKQKVSVPLPNLRQLLQNGG